MEAMVLCAGLGSRLDPLTRRLPKPAVPLAHRPLASFALGQLARAGVRSVRVNLHHLGAALPPALDPFIPEGMRVRYVDEPTLLGTGGGVRNAWEGQRPDGPVIVMNGDIHFAPELDRALAAHEASGAVATMILRPHPDPARLGAIEIDREGRVRRIVGQPERAEGGPLAAYMFTGVHVLSPAAFDVLPESGCIIRRAYRALLAEGAHVQGFVSEAPFVDLGTLGAYLDENIAFAEGRARLPDGSLAEPIHPTASIGAGARVEGSIVGAGAVVAPGAELRHCVLWPGARVEGTLERAIVTPDDTLLVSRCP